MAASTASWTMLFGFVAIVLPPAPSWSRRYVPAHTTFLLKKRHPCLYHSSTRASASSACGGRPALSTAVAMSRAMAMTALINKLTSRPFVFFWNVPSKSTRAAPSTANALRNEVVSGCGTRALAAEPRTGSAPRSGLGDPLTDHSAGEGLHRVVQLALL